MTGDQDERCDTDEAQLGSPLVNKTTARSPLCIRFRPKDLEQIRLVAARQGEVLTSWIREVVVVRVTALENGLDVPRLKFHLAGHKDPVGEAVSIRFPPALYRRIVKCAAEEGQLPSGWIRATVVEYASRPVKPVRQVAAVAGA